MSSEKGSGKFSDLTLNQKESIAILSIGTLLEYFDLMLYVHMSVFLNEIFFPQSDPKIAGVISAFAFCSTYLLRPFGALIFGYVGDNFGRKSTVVITTLLMSISCIVMANLPTYSQIGITASWIVTICRMVQGISSMGEVSGANLYITEITNPPVQYSAVMIIAVTGVLGGFCALGVASFVTLLGFNWRLAFWIGAGIACIGAFARTRLRETPDFTNARLRIKRAIQSTNQSIKILDKNLIWNEKVKIRTALSLFFVECSWPVCFYFAYMYCGTILKNSFGFSPTAIIHQNLLLSAIQLFSWGILMYITYYINPLRILKIRLVIFLILLLFCPYLLDHATSANTILLVQSLFVVFGLMGIPAMPIFYKQLPVFKRFTYTTFAYAISRAFIYVVSSFGLEYVMRVFGNYGLLIIVIPTSCFFIYAINYFQSEEKEVHHHY